MRLLPKRRPGKLNRTMEQHLIAAGLDLGHAAELAGTKPKDGSALPMRDLDLSTGLTVKCIKGRERHLWRRVGNWSSPYWLCAYCNVPAMIAYQHEGIFDLNCAAICDEIHPPGEVSPDWPTHRAEAAPKEA